MAKFLANLFLIMAALAMSLGNYWFTFGLWPKSWWSFAGFGLAGIALIVMRMRLDSDK